MEQLSNVPRILGLKNPAVVQETPDRKNIFLKKELKLKKGADVTDVYEQVFKADCDRLKENPSSYPVTLMYMPLFYISQAAASLHYLFGDQDISSSCYSVLYSRQDKTVLSTTLKDLHLENPRIRLVLTS